MKKILTISFILIAGVCFGQERGVITSRDTGVGTKVFGTAKSNDPFKMTLGVDLNSVLYRDHKDLFLPKLPQTRSDTIRSKDACQLGWSYMSTLFTYSFKIEADLCLPDSVCKKMWIEFHKKMCEEIGFIQ